MERGLPSFEAHCSPDCRGDTRTSVRIMTRDEELELEPGRGQLWTAMTPGQTGHWTFGLPSPVPHDMRQHRNLFSEEMVY